MKKFLAVALAGVMSLSAVACLAACGGNDEKGEEREPEVADRQAPAYAEGAWDASLDLTALQEGNGNAISPDLFGLFLEDINYASFALDDNMVVNGSFETLGNTQGGAKYGWKESGATVKVQSGAGALHANNQSYAEVNTTAGGKLTNSGPELVPIAIRNGVDYKFSMFIKGYAGDVTVTVKDNAATYAEGSFTVTESSDWTKYIKTITGIAIGEEGLSVEITFGTADPSFFIDSVAFETTEATSFGMKNYMYKAIADLSPKFFRFPGGCVIEGANFDEAYDWKNSIGAVVTGDNAGDDDVQPFTYPVNNDGATSTATTYGEQATRKNNLNIWQANRASGDYYNHEYGIGFYEYFLLCEALGAKAVPIVNCGASCMIQTGTLGTYSPLAGRHGKKVEDYIQDAIDLIEFAKGDTTTKWGKIREQLGHPAPFEMDYIGVGNEQWGDYYKKYYELFLKDPDFKAALQKYQVRTIVGNGVALVNDCERFNSDGTRRDKGTAQDAAESAHRDDPANFPTVAGYGVVDQHYYVNYTDLFTNTKMYDNYARAYDDETYYYDVFVGEYAANTGDAVTTGGSFEYKQNDWISALSEAAMMTGYERNGDVVKMAAYAPMFGVADKRDTAQQAGRSNDNQWFAANMMYFTNTEVVLTPSYFVQQLFMKNAGTQKVLSSLTFASGAMPTTTLEATTGADCTIDNVYYVNSYDGETKNLIVKIVNAGADEIKFNVNVKADLSLTGIAAVTEISNEDPHAVSTYIGGNAISPKSEKIGFDGGSFGYAVKPYSVVAFRIRVA